MKRALVVDDAPIVSEVVAGYLGRAGFAVDEAGDGPAPVARSAAQPPDLVPDLALPGMDGLERSAAASARAAPPL
ncbi:response regulator [Streptomyces sp. NPDC020792]|uniref:response regulator n=1 Tax=Streptomyces sp. NPDC020792 TaxID=3365089 RepID=UPI00378C3E06